MTWQEVEHISWTIMEQDENIFFGGSMAETAQEVGRLTYLVMEENVRTFDEWKRKVGV